MLVARRTIQNAHFICPYCGKLFTYANPVATKDHIVPKSLWTGFRETRQYKRILESQERYYPAPEHDPKNLVYSCFPCNRNKSARFVVPNWDSHGEWSMWGTLDLKVHSEYFYLWSNAFIEYFGNLAVQYRNNSVYSATCRKKVDDIYAFRAEYAKRLRTDSWEFV